MADPCRSRERAGRLSDVGNSAVRSRLTETIRAVAEERKWHYLALRHLRIGFRLLRSGYADGATFHGYHSYGCLLGALNSAKGRAMRYEPGSGERARQQEPTPNPRPILSLPLPSPDKR